MRVIGALWLRNVRLFARNRVQLLLLFIMPFFYLYLLSTIFKSTSVSQPIPYVLAGIVMIVVFQTSLNIATSTIEDIVSGYMKEVLVSPVRRISIVFGQILSSTTVAAFQAFMILAVGYALGLTYTSMVTPIAIAGFVVLVGLVFSSFGLWLAASVKSSQTFQIVSVAVTTPITFLCGVYVPLSLLPEGLQTVALLNPITYAAAYFRALSLEKLSLPADELVAEQLAFRFHDVLITPVTGLMILAVFGIICVMLSAIAFTRADFSAMNRSAIQKDVFQQ